MVIQTPENDIRNIIHRINRAWQEGHPEEIEPLLHPNVVMVFPGFSGRSRGVVAMMAGFQHFCAHATVLDYTESNLEVEVVGNTASATFRFAMLYERDGRRYRSTGRDLWMFGKEAEKWLATWRTMLDVHEEEVS